MNTDFLHALIAFGNNHYTEAAALAEQAAQAEPSSLVYPAAAQYLARVAAVGKQGVYVSGEGFAAFIRGGGNIPLYERTSAALAEVYAEYEALRLLDIGVGDGLALLPALRPQITHIDLLEPSAAMLAQTSAALQAKAIAHQTFNSTLQTFASEQHGHWDVAQATFSLQSLSPEDQLAGLGWLREHSGRLLIAEFDPPAFGDDLYAPERAAHMVERYEQGLAEYAADGDLVAQGFLMPVFFGYFDQSAARTNYEQPIASWEAALRSAGYTTIKRKELYPYWWATAYLLDAS